MFPATSNFLVPNATFFVELAAFLVVLFILGRYILPRITKPMEERQATIRQALEDAEEAKRRAAEAEEEYRRAISEARSQARAVVDEANRLAEQMRTERRREAEEEYERILARRPSAEELAVCRRYVLKVGQRAEALEDILWSLVNSTEFLLKK